MDCEQMQKDLSAELDGEVAEAELISVYRHLAECPRCRQWRRDIVSLRGAFACAEPSPLPAIIARRLQGSGYQRSHRGEKSPTTGYRVPRPLAWAAALLFVLQTGWLALEWSDSSANLSQDRPAETIILTGRDRTSSSILVRTASETDEINRSRQNGG
jgi:predicted anti-sigma-YlaC factor YlaD